MLNLIQNTVLYVCYSVNAIWYTIYVKMNALYPAYSGESAYMHRIIIALAGREHKDVDEN